MLFHYLLGCVFYKWYLRGSRKSLPDDDKFVLSVTDSVLPGNTQNYSKTSLLRSFIVDKKKKVELKLLKSTVSSKRQYTFYQKNSDGLLMLKRNRQSFTSGCVVFFPFPFLTKFISSQTANYLGMCLRLVICTPIHLLNRILFTVMHGHLLFFPLPWKRGISCWLVERNFQVNIVTINSSKRVPRAIHL